MNIGIDLSGTNIAAAIVDEHGQIVRRTSVSTNAQGGAKGIIDGLVSVCDYLLLDAKNAPQSIGIGVPGIANAETGEVIYTPNLPLSRINITRELKNKYKCPVILGNDADCATVGEAFFGGAKGTKDVAFITLGTGVGGGVLVGGKLLGGVNGAAGELGHMVTVAGGRTCGCGRQGCWERYASAPGLIATAVELMGTYNNSALWKLTGGLAEKVDVRIVFEAFRAGDACAKSIVAGYIRDLGIGALNIINIFQPELLCIGGGISDAWDCIEKPLIEFVDAGRFSRTMLNVPQTRIVRAALGNDSGIIGAAVLHLAG